MPGTFQFKTPDGNPTNPFPVLGSSRGVDIPLAKGYDPSYDKNYRYGMNQEYNRSENQSTINKIYNGLISRTTSIAPKALGGLGSVIYGVGSVFGGDVQNIWDNPITTLANNADESLNEMFPVFKSREYSEGGLWPKLWTASFWTTDFLDGAAYAASAYAPGGVIGKTLGAIGDVAKSGKAGAKLLQGLTKYGVTAERTNLVAATAYNTTAEAAAEAYQTKHEIKQLLMAQGMDEKTATEKAAKAASETFKLNMGVLLIPNFIQNQFFHGSWNDKTKAVRDAFVASKTGGAAVDISKLAGSYSKQALQGVVSEGFWEENAQTSIQRHEREAALGFIEKDMFSDIASNMLDNTVGFAKAFAPGINEDKSQTEGAMSIFLGGLLGAGFGVMSAHQDRKQVSALLAQTGSEYDAFMKTMASGVSQFRENITSVYKKDGATKVKIGDQEVEVPKYMLDENGDPKLDDVAILNLVHSQLRDVNNWHQAMRAALTNNQTLDLFNKELSLASYAYHLSTSQNRFSKQNVEDMLRAFENVGDMEAKNSGYDTFIKENTNKVMGYLQAIEEANSRHTSTKSTEDVDAYAFQKFMTKADLYTQARLKALDAIEQNNPNLTDEDKDAFTKLREDTVGYMEAIKNDKKGIEKDFIARVASQTTKVRRAEELKNKKDKTQEEWDELKSTNYLLSEEAAINGNHTFNNTGGRSIPIGLNTKDMVKTKPGYRDSYQHGVGMSDIALDDINELLDRDDSIQATATATQRFAKDVVADSSKLQETKDKLKERLSSAQDIEDNIKNNRIQVADIVDTLLQDAEDHDTTVGEYLDDKYSHPGDADVILELINKAGLNLTRDMKFNPKFASDKQTEADNVFHAVNMANRESDKTLQAIEDYKQQLADVDAKINDRDNEYNSFVTSPNKEKLMKEKFFRESVQKPAESLIKRFEVDEDNFEDLQSLDNVTDALRTTLATYRSRKDENNPTSVPIEAQRLLDYLESIVRPAYEKNMASRSRFQIAANEEVAEAILDIFSQKDILDLLKEVLEGPKVDEALKIINSNPEYTYYDAIQVLLSSFRAKATKEQNDKMLGHLDRYRDVAANKFKSLLSDTDQKRIGDNTLVSGPKYYPNQPHLLFPWMISSVIFDKQLKDDDQEKYGLLHKFSKDHDLGYFERNLANFGGMNDNEKEMFYKLINEHRAIAAATSVIDTLSKTKVDFMDVVEQKEKFISAPSLQQSIVLADVLKFLFNDNTSFERFSNWILSTGIGGAGKTFVVGKLAPQIWSSIASQSLDTVYAFSHSIKASENINQAVFGKAGGLFETFMNMTDAELSKLKLLIIDEVFTFTNSQLEQIQEKLAKHYSTTKNHIKVIALGDQSQKTAEVEPILLTTQAYKISSTIPLTSSFRTNVGAIGAFINQFRLSPKSIETGFVTANKTIEEAFVDPASAFGVMSVDTDSLIALLNKPSSRSRVLIVATPADAAFYGPLVKGTQVVTVEDAQGYQWDEVYTALNPNQLGLNPFEKNQNLYTAFSRAKSLLVISNMPGINNASSDPNMNNSMADSRDDLDRNMDRHKANIEAAKQLKGVLTGQSIVSPAQIVPEEFIAEDEPLVETDTSATSFVQVDEEEEATIPPPTVVEVAGQKMSLTHPSNSAARLFTTKDGNKVPAVTAGVTGHIIHATSGSGANTKHSYYVVAPHAMLVDTDNSPLFMVVGVLSDADFKNNPSLSTLVATHDQKVDANLINPYQPFSLGGQVKRLSLAEVQVSNVSRMRTTYLPSYKRSNNNRDIIEDTIIHFYDTFFGLDPHGSKLYPLDAYDQFGNVDPKKDWVITKPNGDRVVNWPVVKNRVQFKIIEEKDKKSLPSDLNLMVGVPYLIFTNPQQKNSTKSARPMYVRFQPKPFSINSPRFAGLRQVYEAVNVIEMNTGLMLGTAEFKEMVDDFVNANFEVVYEVVNNNGNEESIRRVEVVADIVSVSEDFEDMDDETAAKIDEALKVLGRNLYGAKSAVLKFDTQQEAEDYLDRNGELMTGGEWKLTNSNKQTYIITGVRKAFDGGFTLSYRTDAANSNEVRSYQTEQVRAGNGPAQTAWNTIAQANRAIGPIQLRSVTHTQARKSSTVTTIKKGMNILSDASWTDFQAMESDSRIAELGWDFARAKKEKTTLSEFMNFLKSKLGDKVANEILDQYTTKPVTSLTLGAAVDDAMFINGEHVSLREPLHIKRDNGTGINDIGAGTATSPHSLDDASKRGIIASQVMTAFGGIEKTTIEIILPTVPDVPPPPPPTDLDAAKLLDTYKSSIPYLNNLINTLKPLKSFLSKVKIVYAPHFTVEMDVSTTEEYVTKNGNTRTRKVVSVEQKQLKDVLFVEVVNGIPTIYTTLNPSKVDAKTMQLYLHEMLHALTITHIDQGRLDIANGVDSASALFVTRIKALQKRFNALLAFSKPSIDKRTVYERTISKLDEKEFIANLSNPEFYKYASSFAVTPKGKSLISEILRAIADLVTSLFPKSNLNIYDATLASFMDLYKNVAEIKEDLEVETVSVPTTEYEARVRRGKEILANQILKYAAEDRQLTGTIDKTLDIVDKYVDEDALEIGLVEWLPSFESKTPFEQYEILQKLMTTAIVSRADSAKSDLSFAYYDVPHDVTAAGLGTVSTTYGLADKVREQFGQELTDEQANLLYSIIHQQIVNPNSNLIDNLVEQTANANVSYLVDVLWFSIFSPKDRSNVKEAFGISDGPSVVNQLIDGFGDSQISLDFLRVIETLSEKKDNLSLIFTDIENRGAEIYKEAKNFVVDLIRKNYERRNSETERMLTREDMYILIKEETTKLKVTTNGVTREGTKITELREKLQKAYESLAKTKSANIKEKLRNKTIPELENEINGLLALASINERTGKSFLSDIIDDLYPRNPFKKIEEAMEDIAKFERADADHTTKTDTEAYANIQEHIKEYNTSNELTLSESMKDFLTNTAIGQGNDRDYLSPGLIYIKTLQLAISLEWSQGLSNVITQLNDIKGETISEIDNAVRKNLKQVITTAITLKHLNGELPTDKVIVSHVADNGRVSYAVARSTAKDISNMTYEELMHDKDVTITKRSSSSYELAQALPDVDVLLFNKLLERAEALNVVRAVQNTMVSMKDTDLYIATRSAQKGEMAFIKAKSSGITFNMYDEVVSALADMQESGNLKVWAQDFENKLLNGDTKLNKKRSQIRTDGTGEQKAMYIKDFFKALLPSLTGLSIKPELAGDQVTKIKAFLDLINKARIGEVVEGDEDIEIETFWDFIADIDGYLTSFAEIAATASDFVRNPSVGDLNGNKFYKYHESSMGFDILNSFVDADKRNSLAHGATGRNTFRRLPEHLQATIYNYNIFGRNNDVKSKIYAVGEYTGAKNTDVGAVTPYLRENKYYFFHRKFVQGFLSSLRQYEGDRYMQFSFIPSDKPKHPVALISLLSDHSKDNEDSQITKGIKAVLLGILHKEGGKLEIKNYNKSATEDTFRNFEVAATALKELNTTLTKDNVDKVAAKIVELLEKDASELLDELLASDFQLKFDQRTYTTILKLMNKENYKLNEKFKTQEIFKAATIDSKSKFKTGSREKYSVEKNQLLAVFDLFYKNNYVNAYHLNQLTNGDFNAFKNAEDQLKRQAGVFAPGIRPLVDNLIGMKETYRTLVLADNVVEKASTEQRLRSVFFGNTEATDEQEIEFQRIMSFFGDDFESTDAQGFITPARARDMGRGFERSWGLGKVHKPVHFEIQKRELSDGVSTAIPVYVKYSAVELTDSLTDKFPLLKRLRDNMEYSGHDEAVFESAVKVGTPLVRNKLNELTSIDFSRFTAMEPEEAMGLRDYAVPPTLTLSNKHFRLQHNPASDPSKYVSIFTQLMYFLNVFEGTQEQATIAYSAVGELIRMGREQFEKEVGIVDGVLTSKDKLTKFLKKKFNGPGAERVLDLVTAGISLNNPLIEKKAIIALASSLESSTVKIKFPGGKLVMQSSIGAAMINPNISEERELQYGTEVRDGKTITYVEVIMPEKLFSQEQLDAIKAGKSLYLYGDGMGYRIPSTELHSAVPLKVVATYDDHNTNIVIAPKEIVPIQGLDQYGSVLQ